MKIVEEEPVPTIYVNDFCDHQILGEDVHARGYQLRRNEEGMVYGVIKVRLVMNAKNFFAACYRGAHMAKTGELPIEMDTVSTSHH